MGITVTPEIKKASRDHLSRQPEIQRGPHLLTGSVVLKNGVLAERLISPGDDDVLLVGRRGVVTAKHNRGEQGRNTASLGDRHLDGEHVCGTRADSLSSPNNELAHINVFFHSFFTENTVKSALFTKHHTYRI